MELRLDGKTAIVTGASRGIGLAIARRLAESGAKVMITSRKAEALAAAAAELPGEVAFFAANAGDGDAAAACVDAALARFGSIDVLVNNAATNPYYGPLMDLDAPRATKTVEVNQLAPLVWTQRVWHATMSVRGGTVINIASIGGLTVEPGIAWYNVSKAALIHLTRHLAAELGPLVRVNGLAPGLVKTDFARALWERGEDAIARRLPLRRLGEPDDIARAALFLASDAASWITGEVLVVDGGASVTARGGVTD
jgi:NAD(P)-dependent dehydrogenase (short-subunit alcohol dehydrogenase family)